MAERIRAYGCFSRAKSKLHEGGVIMEVSKRDGEGHWLWQLSDKYVQDNRLSLTYRASFWFDSASGTVGASDPALQTKIEALFAEYGGLYLAVDLMRLVHRVFTAQRGLLALRRHGGVYFVPEVNRPLLEKVMQFLQAIGCIDCVVTNVGVVGEGSLRDKAVTMLVESTKARITAIQAELKAIEGDGDKKLSRRKAKNRWKELQAQLDRIKVFAQSLGVESAKLMADASSEEIDLGLLATSNGDMEVVAALAHSGDLHGALAMLAQAGQDEPDEEPEVDGAEKPAAKPAVEETAELPLDADIPLEV
jgi:hypothetical protein